MGYDQSKHACNQVADWRLSWPIQSKLGQWELEWKPAQVGYNKYPKSSCISSHTPKFQIE